MFPQKHLVCSFLLLFCLFFCEKTSGQTKVLGKPLRFEMPIDCFNETLLYQEFLNDTKNKSKKDAWLVVSDRDQNAVYDRPIFGSSVIGSLSFREYFFVEDEDGDWVKLVDAQVDGLKILRLNRSVGWVPKKNLLLWNGGLVGQNNQIHKKVLLLNRADDIKNILKLADKSTVEIYRSPEASEKEPNRTIFEFYFILKKEHGRFLLSEEAVLSPYTIDRVIGWVSERRCSSWDNRICLEPNFSEAGFAERAANPRFKVRAFQHEESAQIFAETNSPETDVFWKDDPVDVKPKKLAASDKRRFNGYVLRFPMLHVSTKNVGGEVYEYYRSGIVGSIKVRRTNGAGSGFDSEIAESDYSRIKNYVNELDQRIDNVNLFFVVEGTDSSFAFRASIAQAMRNIQTDVLQNVSSVRYGALFYRDIPEEKVQTTTNLGTRTVDRLVESMALTPDMERVASFVEKADFQNRNDRDEYTALYYGLSQALKQSGFRENELNIVFLIGNYGDYRADKDRKIAAQEERHKTFFDDLNPVFESLNKLDAHFYTLQLRRDASRASDVFARQGQFLALETAKLSYNKYYGNRQNPQTKELLTRLERDHQIEVSEPSMANADEMNDIPLVGGRYPSRLLRPAVDQYLPPVQVTRALVDNARNSIEFERMLHKIVSDVFVKGQDMDAQEIEAEYNIDAGRFAPALADWLNQMLSDDQIAQKDLFNALDDKYKLYTEVYLPRQIKGAKNPTVLPVLFMPESDLNAYLRIIQRCLGDAESSYDKKRSKLFEIYTELLVQFSGETLLRQRKAEDFTRSELIQVMQGLYGSGLHLDVPIDIRIGDIRNERKVTNAQVDELLERFTVVEKTLSNALRGADQFDFCYTTDANNRYYWIPLSDTF